jgi:glycosyltransferase involved in cell wall biosynthesis
VPASLQEKKYPRGRPIRLGTVARLQPVKGVPLAIHTANLLRNAGLDVQLRIAGDGPERGNLEKLVAQLGLESQVRFPGVVRDMASFYSSIDCLIHLPLTEAFGLVGLEAAAYGCPVIAAAVDGLTESVRDGVSGRCLRPSLPLSEYERLGSGTSDVPPEVYDPLEDRMRPAQLVDPAVAAAALQTLFADSQSYEDTSRAAARRVLSEFRFEDHVNAVLEVIESVARR